MKCPSCGHLEDKVVDSRPAEDGAAIRRRRECLHCKHRFTTYEKVESLPIFVVKKDGAREAFSREKLLSGMTKACQKRPVTLEQLDNVVTKIEQSCAGEMNHEVSTQAIGELVMAYLRELDKVAYVRFASVYRQFADVDSFMNEMKKLVDPDFKSRGKEETDVH